MKKIREIIWWMIGIYLAAGYIFTRLYRLRFFVFILLAILVLMLLDLERKVRFYGIIALMVPALFFFKIIPSPYGYFIENDVAMSISVILTVMTVFLSTCVVLLICNFFASKYVMQDSKK